MFFRRQSSNIPQFIKVQVPPTSPVNTPQYKSSSSFSLQDLIDCLENNHEFCMNNLNWMLAAVDETISGLLEELLKRDAYKAASFLIQECETSIGDKTEALLVLCTNPKRKTSLARGLLNQGANPDYMDSYGQSLLHVCYAASASIDFLSLVAAHANVNSRNLDGDTVLHEAIRASDDRTVKLLLTNGADPNMLDGHGQFPLVMAAHLPLGECLLLLIHRGANVNATDAHGRTALALIENPAASMILVDQGARSDIQDKDGVAPLHTALGLWCRWRRGESLTLLLFREKNMANKLFEQASCIDLPDNHGRTSLHYACEVRYSPAHEYSRALVQEGAGINIRDKNGWTPLHTAVAFGNYATAATLVDLGADIEACDTFGRTPTQLLGLHVLATQQLPQETLSHAIRVVAFGPEAPPAPFVAPLSDLSAAENDVLMESGDLGGEEFKKHLLGLVHSGQEDRALFGVSRIAQSLAVQ
mmetsp:Transcript_373/g.780  ORF Transcript_373/g.780 Transcript_373/m.780 type:complete len:474 (+) Transcript_373:112-1533(+)